MSSPEMLKLLEKVPSINDHAAKVMISPLRITTKDELFSVIEQAKNRIGVTTHYTPVLKNINLNYTMEALRKARYCVNLEEDFFV